MVLAARWTVRVVFYVQCLVYCLAAHFEAQAQLDARDVIPISIESHLSRDSKDLAAPHRRLLRAEGIVHIERQAKTEVASASTVSQKPDAKNATKLDAELRAANQDYNKKLAEEQKAAFKKQNIEKKLAAQKKAAAAAAEKSTQAKKQKPVAKTSAGTKAEKKPTEKEKRAAAKKSVDVEDDKLAAEKAAIVKQQKASSDKTATTDATKHNITTKLSKEEHKTQAKESAAAKEYKTSAKKPVAKEHKAQAKESAATKEHKTHAKKPVAKEQKLVVKNSVSPKISAPETPARKAAADEQKIKDHMNHGEPHVAVHHPDIPAAGPSGGHEATQAEDTNDDELKPVAHPLQHAPIVITTATPTAAAFASPASTSDIPVAVRELKESANVPRTSELNHEHPKKQPAAVAKDQKPAEEKPETGYKLPHAAANFANELGFDFGVSHPDSNQFKSEIFEPSDEKPIAAREMPPSATASSVAKAQIPQVQAIRGIKEEASSEAKPTVATENEPLAQKPPSAKGKSPLVEVKSEKSSAANTTAMKDGVRHFPWAGDPVCEYGADGNFTNLIRVFVNPDNTRAFVFDLDTKGSQTKMQCHGATPFFCSKPDPDLLVEGKLRSCLQLSCDCQPVTLNIDSLFSHYTQKMVNEVGPICTKDGGARILNIGLGGGALSSYLLAKCAEGTRVTSVEKDPRVVAMAARFFGFKVEEGRNEIDNADAGDAVARRAKQGFKYDAIVVDCFEVGGSIPESCRNAQFVDGLHKLLDKDGIVVQQVWVDQYKDLVLTYKEVFEASSVRVQPVDANQNVLVIAKSGKNWKH